MAGAFFCPGGIGACPTLGHHYAHDQETPRPRCFRFHLGFHHLGMLNSTIGHVVESPAPLGLRGGAESSKYNQVPGKALPSQDRVVFIGKMRMVSGPAVEGCHPDLTGKAGSFSGLVLRGPGRAGLRVVQSEGFRQHKHHTVNPSPKQSTKLSKKVKLRHMTLSIFGICCL